MANTLTMKEEPKTELTSDEQESLAIGEELEQQQDQLLAGKYKTAEDLEKAYKELESKLGSTETEVKGESKKEAPKEPAEEVSFLEGLWNEAQNNDEFSKETISKLQEMDPTKIAQEYLDYRANNVNTTETGLTTEDVNVLYDTVGSKKEYDTMIKWAGENLSKNEVSMFDSIIDKGDKNACYFAVKAVQSLYNDATGVEGKLLTGKAAKSKPPGYKSQQQLIEAMSDPRYDKDPAYRQDVIEKLSRSDIDF